MRKATRFFWSFAIMTVLTVVQRLFLVRTDTGKQWAIMTMWSELCSWLSRGSDGLVGADQPVTMTTALQGSQSPATIKDQRRGWSRIRSTSKFAGGVVVGASLTCALAAAAPGSRHNGAFWSRLGNQDKAAYVAGYSDAAHFSIDKIDKLKLAGAVLQWRNANKILAQTARGLDISDLSAATLIAYLDKVYSNPRYDDFDMGIAIELAARRGIDARWSSREVLPPVTNPNLER